jgi:MFS transporter, PAT family, beta-lactamase induction signal transducer AmpG
MSAPLWLDALRVYADRRMAGLWALGFASGLPRLLVHSTLTFWLIHVGVSIELVGLFALTSLPYSLKFFIAPLLDRYDAPLWGARLGRRRGWILWTQLGLGLCLMACMALEPGASLIPVAALMALIAALSAAQDVVIDALRIELLEPEEQGAGAAAAVFGYRVAMLVAGAGALALAFWWSGAWGAIYALMGGLMLGCAGVTLLLREPDRPVQAPGAPRAGLREAIRSLASAPAASWMLALVMTYKLGDALAGAMVNPLLASLGFDTLVIAGVAKTWGLGASLLGVGMGGWMVRRLGMMRTLWIAGVMQLASNLVFSLQAVAGADARVLVATVGTENLCGGIGTAAFVALLSGMCKRELSATQYALLTALSSVLVTLLSSPMGFVAARLGWPLYFGFTALCALPGLLVVRAVARRAPQDVEARRRALEEVFE